ncbi:MAG: hypothetical protein LBS36_08220 [Oscillospiraceae bacterium]|nr:hypothetical protein [Oscillospiraceae bacterium]
MTNTGSEQIWKNIVEEFSKNPRDVKTIPNTRREPKWFFVFATCDHVFVKSGHNHTNRSEITMQRPLKKTELEIMLDLYHRRKQGETITATATQTTRNQVYWYGIFAEMDL